MTSLDRWEQELARLRVTFRWGETRRFQSNTHKINRQQWLIEHIAAAKAVTLAR